MADLVLGVAKSLVEGTLTKAQAAIEEESKLRQSTQRDLVFIVGEFQMMQSFLSVTTEEHIRNNVVSTWVTQVRDLAYDVEDCIEFVLHLDPKNDWWRRLLVPPFLRRSDLPLDEAVGMIEQLKARVQDVSQRNSRYNLIIGGDSAPPPPVVVATTKQTTVLALSSSGGEASSMMMKQRDDSDAITGLITMEGTAALRLQVISVWTMGDDDLVGATATTIMRKAYDNPKIWGIFGCRAWVKIDEHRPFNLQQIIRSMLEQFYANSSRPQENHDERLVLGVDALRLTTREAAAKKGEVDDNLNLLQEFLQQVSKQKYLLVLEGVSTLVEWDAIRKYLPDKQNGSCILVSTQDFDIASFCTGLPYFQRLSAHDSLCVFSKEKAPQIIDHGTNNATNRGILMDLIGRKKEINELPKYPAKARVNAWQVMSVWGIAGAGKSSLVRNVYDRKLTGNHQYEKHGWVDISHPFHLRNFCQSLLLQLHTDSFQADEVVYCDTAGIRDPVKECNTILRNQRCLVVIDRLESTGEWDLIQAALVSRPSESIFIVITNEASIAFHCADRKELVFNVKCLEAWAAFDLFKREIQTKNPRFPANVVDTNVEIQTLISKCGGLPKVIVTLADFLAPLLFKWKETAVSMNKNKEFMHNLETKPEFAPLQSLFGWMGSYFRTCPDYLRPCIFYLSIFPGYCDIRRRRLVMRWVAEGYSKDSDSLTSEETGEELFSKLVEMSMVQPPPQTITTTQTRMVLCRVSAFFHEYIISRPTEENITFALEVFALEGCCRKTTRRTGRHLIIEKSWDRDKIAFESIDFSRLRSLTVFGEWRPFFICKSMKVLRVLDLEDASGVRNEDLDNMLKLLPRLKFLSLRKCREISHIPDSLGNLRQLQILDVRDTCITFFPKTITKLQKLQYIRAGISTSTEPNRHHQVVVGVELPAGAGLENLTALHTLGVINVGTARGKDILLEAGNLSQLRKLGVSGVSKKNSTELCSAISGHAHIESLSVWMINKEDDPICLEDDLFRIPPKNLQSLKLYGLVDKLPQSISMLPKLKKLDVEITMSSTEIIDMTVIGGLPELLILRLCVSSRDDPCQDGKLDFLVKKEGVEDRSYEKVKVLEIDSSFPVVVSFGSQAMKNLEHLVACCATAGLTLQFDQISHFSKLRKVQLSGLHNSQLRGHLEEQLKIHANKPAFELQL